jgi:hypothetical protein
MQAPCQALDGCAQPGLALILQNALTPLQQQT